jgi:hypothetical protein
MKKLLKLAVLAVASTAALAFAGNALAVQKLSVTQSATSLTIKVTQAQTDPQPAKIQIFVPTGYTLNTTAAPGTVIGTTSGSVFARDANIPLPLSGDVVVAPPNTNAAPCFTTQFLQGRSLPSARSCSSRASHRRTSRRGRRAARRTAHSCSRPTSR